MCEIVVMTDRLGDLKRGSPGGGPATTNDTVNHLHNTQGIGLFLDSFESIICYLSYQSFFLVDNFMKRFFGDVEIIKSHLTKISQATEQLRDIHSEVLKFTLTIFPTHTTSYTLSDLSPSLSPHVDLLLP